MSLVDKKNIVWLASYPKSGNTWFRAFLTALLSTDNTVAINQLRLDYNFANSSFFERIADINPSELLGTEIDEFKPAVVEYLSQQNQESDQLFVKIHEYFRLKKNGQAIIPTSCTLTALYFIRNPLDIVVSYAHHDTCSFDKVIDRMSKNYTLGLIKTDPEFFNIPEQLGSWSQHIQSWGNNGKIPVEVIRYEDMHLHPLETFSKAVRAIGLTETKEKITAAITASSFDALKAQENNTPFQERTPESSSFFRQGKIGSWRAQLSSKQIQKVINDHQVVMQQFGYLTTDGRLIY